MNVIQVMQDVEILDARWFEHLKILAKASPLKRSRILLHDSPASTVQEMVLCIHRESYIRPHRHPVGKCESYHIIEGELHVSIYAEDGRIDNWFKLSRDSGNLVYRLRGGIYHQPRATSEWAIYHEVYTGPFDKQKDVEYAPWAAPEAV